MQPVSSRIWTRVAVFISYDDNDYTTGTSKMKVEVIILIFTYFNFPLKSTRTAKSTILQVLFFAFIISSVRLTEIRLSVYISISQRSLWVSLSRTDAWFCLYHLFIWSKLNFLHNTQWITPPKQSCLVLYSFFTNLFHSLIYQLFRLYTCVRIILIKQE